MKYTIYKITNSVNGKIYIGKHQTVDLTDNYMGSGKLLRLAQGKYGIENFAKEILHVFDTEEEMNAKETELVTEEFCQREDTYNICVGGQGGFSYINSNPDIRVSTAPRAVAAQRKTLLKTLGVNHVWKTPEHRQKILQINAARKGIPSGIKTFEGRTHSVETRQRMSDLAKARKTNSQSGTMWITNGHENKKIKSVDNIPEGWYKGRKIKNI